MTQLICLQEARWLAIFLFHAQLRLSGRHLGLLINFGEVHLKHGIERIVNGLPEDKTRNFDGKLLSIFASLASFV